MMFGCFACWKPWPKFRSMIHLRRSWWYSTSQTLKKNQPEGEPVISQFHVCWFHTACVARFLRKNLPKKLSSVDWWAVGATWDDENIGDFTEISPKFGKIREDPPIRWAFNVKAWLTCWLNQHGDKLWQDYGKWALLSGNFWVCQLENRH